MFELIGEFETNGKKFCTVRVKKLGERDGKMGI